MTEDGRPKKENERMRKREDESVSEKLSVC
jgi:hypothetical protein